MPDVNLFNKAEIKVQKKSGFDKSHFNLLTTKCGTLTPILCDEVIPNTDVNLKLNLSASLPPLASETFMRCDLKAEAFFVPYRILYGGFEKWFTGEEAQYLTSGGVSKATVSFPVLEVADGTTIKTGTLADYLGVRALSTLPRGSATRLNALPFCAYHKIYDDWYRNSLIQKPVFMDFLPNSANLGANNAYKYNVSSLPFLTFQSAGNTYNVIPTSESARTTYVDGVKITDLRQRNFGLDYFTTATPNAQNGNSQKVSMAVDTDPEDPNAEFTISALRAANSMQQFLERNNLAGNRMVDYVKAHYGANLSDGIAQRSLLLGSASFDVYTKGIYQTSNISGNTNNPFDGSVGAQFGSARASGSDFIIDHFRANEPGIIMVLVSLVPRVTYSTGIRRLFTHYIGSNGLGKNGGQTDMANPILQNVGNQPIYSYELTGDIEDTGIFGYTDRYAEWKSMDDELHGLLRDGENLQSFALQRSFSGANLTVGSNFLAIPTDYMDQVTAADASISNYGVWIDSYMDYKVSMPLARYAIPSLQDPAYEHGVDVSIKRAGTHL